MEPVEDIVKQLESRNNLYNKFANLIIHNNELGKTNRDLQSLNHQLQLDLEKLQFENNELSKHNTGAPGVERSEHSPALEQKYYRAMEELTEVHRTKGARAQQIIDLNVALQEKEKELMDVHQKLSDKENELKTLTKGLSKWEQEALDLKQANTTLNDEYQALLMANDSVESKLRHCTLENQTLLDRWLHYKDQEAKALNSENDQVQTVLVDKSVRLIPNSRVEDRNEKPNRTQSTVSPSTSPSPVTTSTSFKDRLQNIFGLKQAKSEEHQQVSIHASQYLTIVRLPEEAVCNWKAHESEVTSTRFSSSGGILATGGSDKFVHVWNFIGDKARLQCTLRGCNGAVTSIDFDPQEAFISASSSDYACRIWSVNTQRLRITLTGHRNSVLSSKFLNTSNRLASGSKDRTVKVWDVMSGACVRTFMAGSSCTDIVAADSIDCLASGHFDKKVRMWDARVSGTAQTEVAVGGRVTSLDMPVSKRSLLCCTKDHTLEVVDLRKSSVVSVYSDDKFRVATDQTRCAYSTDGKYVSVGSSDGSVLSWDADTGRITSIAKEHNDPVLTCNWSSGRLVSGDKNKTCIVWSDS